VFFHHFFGVIYVYFFVSLTIQHAKIQKKIELHTKERKFWRKIIGFMNNYKVLYHQKKVFSYLFAEQSYI